MEITTCMRLGRSGSRILNNNMRGHLLRSEPAAEIAFPLLLERIRKVQSLGELRLQMGIGPESGLDDEELRRALRVLVDDESIVFAAAIEFIGLPLPRRMRERGEEDGSWNGGGVWGDWGKWVDGVSEEEMIWDWRSRKRGEGLGESSERSSQERYRPQHCSCLIRLGAWNGSKEKQSHYLAAKVVFYTN